MTFTDVDIRNRMANVVLYDLDVRYFIFNTKHFRVKHYPLKNAQRQRICVDSHSYRRGVALVSLVVDI